MLTSLLIQVFNSKDISKDLLSETGLLKMRQMINTAGEPTSMTETTNSSSDNANIDMDKILSGYFDNKEEKEDKGDILVEKVDFSEIDKIVKEKEKVEVKQEEVKESDEKPEQKQISKEIIEEKIEEEKNILITKEKHIEHESINIFTSKPYIFIEDK